MSTIAAQARAEHDLARRIMAEFEALGRIFTQDLIAAEQAGPPKLVAPGDPVDVIESAVDQFDDWCDAFAERFRGEIGDEYADQFPLTDDDIATDRAMLDAVSVRANLRDRILADHELFPVLRDAPAPDTQQLGPTKDNLLTQIAADHADELAGPARPEVLAALGAKHIAVTAAENDGAAREAYDTPA